MGRDIHRRVVAGHDLVRLRFQDLVFGHLEHPEVEVRRRGERPAGDYDDQCDDLNTKVLLTHYEGYLGFI